LSERIAWIVKTPEGYLGQRRHNYSGTQPERKTSFKFARVFTAEGYARSACQEGDKVLSVTITITINSKD